MHKTIEFCTEWFSVCPEITPKFRTTVILKSSIKENNDLKKICMYVGDMTLMEIFIWEAWRKYIILGPWRNGRMILKWFLM
jgi:DNA-binding transcriptional regulator/RsmH inhibitor MraZ